MNTLHLTPEAFDGPHSKVPYTKDDVEKLELSQSDQILALGGVATRLEYEIDHDEKTGLLTSRGFKKKATEFRTANPNAQLLYLRIDVGNFKGVNDEHGHPFGDYVLSLIGQSFYDGDLGGLFARESGDELVAILNLDAVHNETGQQMTYKQRAQAIVNKVHGIGDNLRESDNRLGMVGFNFAVGSYLMSSTDTLSLADQIADISLYDDKRLQKEKYGSYRNGGLQAIKNAD